MNFTIDREFVKDELNRRRYYQVLLQLNSLYHPKINEYIISNPITDDLLSQYEKHIRDMNDNIFGVFSSSNTFLNKRLWTDFGDNGKGFCVGIDFLKAFPINEGVRGAVEYVMRHKLPKSKFIESENNDAFIKYFFKWILTLPEEYKEEDEYRFAKHISSESERHRIIPKESISEIIIGDKMGKTDRADITKMINIYLPQTKIKRLRISKGRKQEVITEYLPR